LTRKIAGDEKVTTARAELGMPLVTASVLQPEVEEVVLASEEQLEKDYMEALKFNEEFVGLVIAEDNSEFPIDPVPLGVNGKMIYLKRGVEYDVPRKYIECLCQPIARIKTKQAKNNLNEDVTDIESTKSFQFPFRITHDANPKSKQWLTALLRR